MHASRLVTGQSGRMRWLRAGAWVVLLAIVLAARVGVRSAGAPLSADPACQSLTPAAAGGPLPQNPNVLVLRYMGASNYELSYRSTILLLDAYYERTPRARPLGVLPADIRKASAILIGHGHSDHIADAAQLAAQTGARVFGGPPSIEYLRTVPVPEKQLVLVKGGEVERFKDLTVEMILAHHADRDPESVRKATEAFHALVNAATGPPSEADQKQNATILARGSRDPKILTEGTIAFLVSLDSGFHLIFQDSAGPVTEGERQVMNRIGRADVAIVAYQGFWVSGPQVKATMPLVRAFKPRIFMPTHHDETGADHYLDMAGYPLFMAIRDELPDTRSFAPLYRSPVCIDIQTRDVFVSR